MSLRPELLLVASVFLFLMLPGCSGEQDQREWEVILQNQGNVPVSAFVTMGANADSNGSVLDVQPPWNKQIISGQGPTIVNTIKIVRDKEEKVLKINEKLTGGHQYLIVVSAAGGVSTKIHKP